MCDEIGKLTIKNSIKLFIELKKERQHASPFYYAKNE